MFPRCLPLLAGALFLTGCIVELHTGPTRSESRDFDGSGVERLRVDLRMGVGQLRVRGGADKIGHFDYRYNVESWKPDIHFHSNGSTGDLSISQPGTNHAHVGNSTYEWTLDLATDPAIDLIAHLGAGEAQMNLGSLNLRHVELNMGVGEVRMDLRGQPKHDYDVNIHGGVGQATVYLPRDAGVYATGHGGIGEIKAEGLRKMDDHWVNDNYDKASVRVRVNVEGGIGQITLIGR